MKQKIGGIKIALYLAPLYIGCLLAKDPTQRPVTKVDFLTSMEWDAPKNKEYRDLYFASPNVATQTMFLLKALYDKNNFFERPGAYTSKVPKIIHQIWLGPKTPPAIFQTSQQSLKKHHPGWEYKLWTDADIPSFILHNKKFYDLTNNYAEKADILRYELLYTFGGVYVDVDFLCFKPFDVLSQYNLWAALEPLDCSHGTGINNAIIGSVPGHPILKHCIESVEQSWYTGANIYQRVGPEHFKESFVKYAQEDLENIIALPKSFFYPLDYNQGMTYLKKKMKFNSIKSVIRPESFAMHLWAGSWKFSDKKPRKKKKRGVKKKLATQAKLS